MRIGLIILAAIVTLAGCGSSPSVSYWRMPGSSPGPLFEIQNQGTTYRVGRDGSVLRPVPSTGQTLLLRKGHMTSPIASGESYTVLAVLGAGSFTLVYKNPLTGHIVRSAHMIRLSKAAYVKELASQRSVETGVWTDYLASAIGRWATRHAGLYPPPAAVASGTAFGRFVATLRPGWPVNPYTGRPMASGPGPGDYTYTRTSSGFTLVGHLPNDKTHVGNPQDLGLLTP